MTCSGAESIHGVMMTTRISKRLRPVSLLILLAIATGGRVCPADEPPAKTGPDYNREVAPVLRKYCVGCHVGDEPDGGLSLETFADLERGGESGLAVLAGDAKSSRLVRVITGQIEPLMPPEGEPRPTEAEVAVLRAWIDAGATGPEGREPDRTVLITPDIPPAEGLTPGVTALAWSPRGELLAVGRFRTIELRSPDDLALQRTISSLPGKVHALEFSRDGRRLLAASGINGLYGAAVVIDVASGAVLQTLTGHRDSLYAAVFNPDATLVATASYDAKIVLWDLASEKPLRTLSGHNGAVFDLAFSPDGTILASASADETVKLWLVESGLRLDTLGQPLDEQYTVTFSPDGQYVLAGGADNRIRIWRLISRTHPRINPLLYARFAHEGPVLQLAFANSGRQLVSIGEDRLVKVWETQQYTQQHAFAAQPASTPALATTADAARMVVGRLDGSLQAYQIVVDSAQRGDGPVAREPHIPETDAAQQAAEVEPNDRVDQAMPISVPAQISGTIAAAKGHSEDQDLFRFEARAGEVWILETNAARTDSLLDSRIEVLDSDGEPIVRLLLRAVRDSYFTFRGKDSDTIDDFRLHNWQEMELNEYLYANGEVVKLWLYPRGPDSGFQVYPGRGKRYAWFDTTAVSHALQEPCYIVEPHPPGAELIPNGLPVFPLYYQNDDDGLRRLGSDSRLTFTAPEDGTYLVRVSDVRGFQGPDFHYELTIRAPQPDFRVTLTGANPKVNAGGGREFEVAAERIDGFDGPIRIEADHVPDGFHITSPLVIQAGQDVAHGVIWAEPDATAPADDAAQSVTLAAQAEIGDSVVTRAVGSLGKIELLPKSQVLVRIVPAEDTVDATGAHGQEERTPLELEIAPGETVTARVRVERNGFDGRIGFGNADAGRNLPHGVFVDNIGLNGLLIVEGQNERTFFITAAPWVPETTRTFHLRAQVDGNQTSLPVTLHVRRKSGMP